MSDRTNISSKKKNYHTPTCASKSISEIAALFNKKGPEPENTTGAETWRAPADATILLVEGYGGDLNRIGQISPTNDQPPSQNLLVNSEEFVEIQLHQEHDVSSSEPFLLLDLRCREPGRPGPTSLQSPGRTANISDALPIVILVRSMEDFHGWREIAPAHCWQCKVDSPADLLLALRSFLHFCATLAKLSSEESFAPEHADEHFLTSPGSKG